MLFCVGDPFDVPKLWQAKQCDFDASIGLDVEALLGARAGPTLAWLRSKGHADVADEVANYSLDDLDLPAWRVDRERYYR